MSSIGPVGFAAWSNDASAGTAAWNVPSAASADDVSNTSSSLFNSTSQYLKGLNASAGLASIPDDATIDGWIISIKRHATTANTVHDGVLKTVVGGVISGTNKADTVTNWGTTETTVNYGGATDTWGISGLTGADVKAANFGVVLQVVCAIGQAAVNYISITVYYTNPPVAASADGALAFAGAGSAFVTHFDSAAGALAFAGTADGLVAHLGSASGALVFTGTANGKLPTDRTVARPAATSRPGITLQLHSPMPVATPLPSLWLATDQTSLVITTSIERGFESCRMGYPQRVDGIVVPAWLPDESFEYQDYGHVAVSDGARVLFAGRLNQQPELVRGRVMAATAQGYWDALNDTDFVSTDDTLTTSGAVIRAILTQQVPYVRIDEANWIDPNVPHAESEFSDQRGGAAIDSILKEGDGTGVPFDLQFWADPDGELIARLVPRLAPDEPDYECDWLDPPFVSISYDPAQLWSHVRLIYTDLDGTQQTTDWQPALSDGTFFAEHGFARHLTINAGQKSEAGALAYRDNQQALLSQKQWGGTLNVGGPLVLYRAGTGIAVAPRDVVAGAWLRVRGLNRDDDTPILLQIHQTQWNALTDQLQLQVSSGLTRRSLHQVMVQTVGAVRSNRNAVSGAPNP